MGLSSFEDVREVETQLQKELIDRIADFHLAVQDSGLVLHGKTCTYYGKQLAQHLAMEKTGVPVTANEIEVVDR